MVDELRLMYLESVFFFFGFTDFEILLCSNHTETIIKYFVTNLNNHKTQNRSGHLVY